MKHIMLGHVIPCDLWTSVLEMSFRTVVTFSLSYMSITMDSDGRQQVSHFQICQIKNVPKMTRSYSSKKADFTGPTMLVFDEILLSQ